VSARECVPCGNAKCLWQLSDVARSDVNGGTRVAQDHARTHDTAIWEVVEELEQAYGNREVRSQ